MKHVRKSSGKIETFNSKKVSASVRLAFISNHYPEEEAKKLAQKVTTKVVSWLSKKTEVTNIDVRHITAKYISEYDKNVAMLYKKHKDLW